MSGLTKPRLWKPPWLFDPKTLIDDDAIIAVIEAVLNAAYKQG
ncbi:MAG: hypothetical protein V4475_12015 [Pseudomonadota bacterium]